MTKTEEKITAPAAFLTPAQVNLLHKQMYPDFTEDEIALLVQQVERTRLDPFSRQIYASKKWNGKAKNSDGTFGRNVINIQCAIDGFRVVSERHGQYAGMLGPFYCQADGVWKDVNLENRPAMAAKVGILRHDFKEPLWAVAKHAAYVQEDGMVWKKNPDLMTAKCAEALARRQAFPNDLSGLYTSDEMGAVDEPEAPPTVASDKKEPNGTEQAANESKPKEAPKPAPKQDAAKEKPAAPPPKQSEAPSQSSPEQSTTTPPATAPPSKGYPARYPDGAADDVICEKNCVAAIVDYATKAEEGPKWDTKKLAAYLQQSHGVTNTNREQTLFGKVYRKIMKALTNAAKAEAK